MSRGGHSIKSRFIFLLQFWPVIVTIIGGVFYEVKQVAVLSAEVTLLEKSVNRIDDKLDTVLTGKPVVEKMEDGNYVWSEYKRPSHDDKGTRY